MVKPGRKAIREMPPEELARRLDDVVAKGEHKQYAKLERMLFQGETIDGWKLGPPIDDSQLPPASAGGLKREDKV